MFSKTERFPGEGFFTQVPTHWLRDPRASATLKAVLSYWQTHAVGYQVTIEQTIAEMREQKAAIYAAVKHGIELGYLERRQDRDARGRRKAVEYTFGPAAFEQQYVRNWGARPDGTEGPTDDGDAGAAAAVDDAPAEPEGHVSAGGTGSRFSASGPSGSRKPGSRESDTKKINPQKNNSQEISSEEDQKTPPLSAVTSPTREPEAKAGGDFDPILKTAALEAERIRDGAHGWDWGRAYGIAERCVNNGTGRDLVAATLVEIAGDPAGTNHPGRLPHVLAEKSRVPVPRSSGGSGSIPANRERCRTHPTEIAEHCGSCAGEKNGGTDPDGDPDAALPESVAGLTGAALVLAMARQSRSAA